MTAEPLFNQDGMIDGDDCRRVEPRRRVLLSGKIVQPNGINFDCTIRNLTEGGALLKPAAGQIVPNAFELIEIRSGIAYRADVVWRSAAGIGVKFSDRIDLNGAGAPLGLRVLWLGLASRGITPSTGGG
jgi:hypothetical protein